MTDFGIRFAQAMGLCALGVAGFASMWAGAGVVTALLRGLAAGFVFYLFGKILAYALLYDPSTLPEKVKFTEKPGAPSSGKKPGESS